MISDESIRAGLEGTRLLGRSQFLTRNEAETLGVSEASVLVDGGSGLSYYLVSLICY